MPLITRPQVYRVVREMLPRERFGPRGVAAMAEGVKTAQRAGQPLSRKTPLRPPQSQAGAATLKPSL